MNYESLVEEIDAIITEKVFRSRMELIEGYWEVGKCIREFSTDTPITELTERLAVDTGKSARTLWYAVQFYDKFPVLKQLDTLEEGKNLSWSKIITKYLPSERKPHKEVLWECPHCHWKGEQSDFRN